MKKINSLLILGNEDRTVDGLMECKGCAECCYSLTENGRFCIPITKADKLTLKQNKIYQEFERTHHVRITKGQYDYYYPYDLVARGLCPFLDKELKICNIYPDRPSNCKSFFCEEHPENNG